MCNGHSLPLLEECKTAAAISHSIKRSCYELQCSLHILPVTVAYKE